MRIEIKISYYQWKFHGRKAALKHRVITLLSKDKSKLKLFFEFLVVFVNFVTRKLF